MIVKITSICDDIRDESTEYMTKPDYNHAVHEWREMEDRGIISFNIKEVADNEVHVTIYY